MYAIRSYYDSFVLKYDQSLVAFDHIEIDGSISERMNLSVTDDPGMLRIDAQPGLPSENSDILLFVYFNAIETKDARLVQVEISDVTVAQVV